MGMWLAVIAGCLLILGLLRMAQSTGSTAVDRKTAQGAFIMCLGLLVGFVALLVLVG